MPPQRLEGPAQAVKPRVVVVFELHHILVGRLDGPCHLLVVAYRGRYLVNNLQ